MDEMCRMNMWVHVRARDEQWNSYYLEKNTVTCVEFLSKNNLKSSLTHDLSDGDGLGEFGGGAAPSDVDGNHSEQHFLPHWETLHLVLVPFHWLFIRLHPLITWGMSRSDQGKDQKPRNDPETSGVSLIG